MASEHMHPLILDGGMSRELIRVGAPFKHPEWSALALLEAPHYVRTVHADFIAAGANVVTTNSYAIVPFHIGEDRFWQRGEELARLAGSTARQAADAEMDATGKKVLVAGCLPPVFGSYEPDKFDGSRVKEYLQILVNGLAPFVDVWLGETLSLIAEAKAVVDVTKDTRKPVWISFCPDDSERASTEAPRLRSGESITDTTRWALEASIEAVLFNCCRPEFADASLDSIVKHLQQQTSTKLPRIGVYANAFVPRSNDYAANENISATDEELTPDAYAVAAATWQDKGASIIGGCCGIGANHIRAIAMKLNAVDA